MSRHISGSPRALGSQGSTRLTPAARLRPDAGRRTQHETLRRADILSFIGGHLLLCVLCVQIAFAMAIAAAMHPGAPMFPDSPAPAIVLWSAAAGLVLIAACSAVRGSRTHGRQRDHGRFISGLLETLASTGNEWLWAVDDKGIFTFSSRASSALLGYDPADLVGKSMTMLFDGDDLASAQQNIADALDGHTTEWAGVIVSLRHRDGTPVWVEASGRSRRLPDGTRLGSEGISRLLPGQTIRTILKERLRDRIDTTVRNRIILTAFQPIHDLATGKITGVEALARFPDHDDRSPDHWFNEATSVGLGDELEFAALEAALHDAAHLPRDLTVALNLSPETCLDPRLPVYLKESGLAPDRIVLELTERLPVDDYAPLLAALSALRQGGLRIAVDDAGSGFSSMRHILQLRPDVIKLDRSLIAGIDNNRGKQALGAAMVEFANQINAVIIAEGIETEAELTAARNLGMAAGQGYFLGRPTLHQDGCASWRRMAGADSEAPVIPG